MKILKLLSKKYLLFLLLFFMATEAQADDKPVDIWNIEEKEEIKEKDIDIEDLEEEINSTINFKKLENSNLEIIKDEDIESNVNLAGLYDPSDNSLSIDMWLNSDGTEIKKILKRLSKLKLSYDANEIINRVGDQLN